jgi:hypothetical protein
LISRAALPLNALRVFFVFDGFDGFSAAGVAAALKASRADWSSDVGTRFVCHYAKS